MSSESKTGLVIAALVAFVLYLLTRAGFLHENVSATVGVSSQGTVPQFSPSVPSSIPANWPSMVVAPINALGNITTNISDPNKASCPVGYQLWRNSESGAFWCILSHLSDGSQGPV